MSWRYIESSKRQEDPAVRAKATPDVSSSRKIAAENESVGAIREAATHSGGGHQLVNISLLAPRAGLARHPTLQAKLKVSQPEDFHEREADQVADDVMRMPEPIAAALPAGSDEETNPDIQTQSSAAGITPKFYRQSNKAGTETEKSVSEFTSGIGNGTPLDNLSRNYFEPRFGHDFSQVRIHADAQANEGARRLNAQAYTHGRDIYFGSGFYQPHSDTGRRLLAHELTHTVQQSGSALNAKSQRGETAHIPRKATSPLTPFSSSILSRAPSREQPVQPAAPFYQEALDKLDAEKRQIITIVRSQIIPDSVPALERLVTLCKAIDRGAVADVKPALNVFLSEDIRRLQFTPSEALLAEMTARMILLGMDGESDALRRWGLAREKVATPSIGGPYAYDIYAWERIEERLLGRIPETGGNEGLSALDGLLVFFGQLVRERFSLNEEDIRKDSNKRAALYDNPFVQRDRTISVYATELVRMMRLVFSGIQSAFQLVLDQADADLAAGHGDAMLVSAKDRHEKRLLPLIEPGDKSQHIGGVAVETTKSEFKKGGGTHRDALATTDAARAKRSVAIHFYDAKQDPSTALEMSSDFAGVFIARGRQIALIEEIYGLQKDDKGKITAESKENAAAMLKLGANGLRLQNDDDWRKFVVAKFEMREATDGVEKALISVIALVESYMRVFTTHTPYNIEDFGDNLLTKTFPRDLAGRLIHDCGVYALRTAYILSLLRDHPHLQLRFRYVIMPLHVGLLITGNGLPTFLVNNDEVRRYSASDVAEMQKEWNQLNEKGEKSKVSKRAAGSNLAGELMANAFIPGTDIPYKEVDVVKSSGSAAKLKVQMWQQYTRDIAPSADRLFGPSVRDKSSPNYQFYLQYLQLLDLFRQHYNNTLVPFWNVKASNLWDTHKTRIKSAFDALQNAGLNQKAAAQMAYDVAVKPYIDALESELSAAQQAANPILLTQIAIQSHISAHPEVFASGTVVASADRIQAMFDALGVRGTWWEAAIYEYLFDLRSGAKFGAPFEKPEDKLMPLN